MPALWLSEHTPWRRMIDTHNIALRGTQASVEAVSRACGVPGATVAGVVPRPILISKFSALFGYKYILIKTSHDSGLGTPSGAGK